MTEHSQTSWDAYNNLLLYGELGRFSKLLARYELYKMTMELPGDIVEGGIFKGAGLFYWAKLIQIFHCHTSRIVVGFDTFQGYPQSTRPSEEQAAREFQDAAEFQPVTVENLTCIATAQGLQPRIDLVKGNVEITAKDYVKAHPGFRIALLNLDFDTYAATKAMLDALYDLVVPRGVVVLDEYAVGSWGESDAVDELIRKYNLEMKAFSWTHSPSAYFIKGH